jgi:hypothetical protein
MGSKNFTLRSKREVIIWLDFIFFEKNKMTKYKNLRKTKVLNVS